MSDSMKRDWKLKRSSMKKRKISRQKWRQNKIKNYLIRSVRIEVRDPRK